MEIMEKQFSEKLAKHEVAPPADIWHKISDRLDREELLNEAPKAKVVWFTRERMLRVAAAAVLLIGVESVIHFYFKDDASTVATSVKTNETTTPQENTATEVISTEPAVVKTTVAQVEKTSVGSAINNLEKTANSAEIPGVQEAVAHEEIIVAPVPQIAVVETKEEQVASTPTTNNANNNSTSVSSNTVPVYSLKLLDKDIPANDEITVIDPKAKKVIIIEKGIDKPKINYNTPKRF